MKKIEILGIQLSNLNYNEVLERIISLSKNSNHYSSIFTPNVDFLIKANEDTEFKNILNKADISIPDGMPLIWASKFLGESLKMKVSGSSLFFKLCEIALGNKIKMFLLGGNIGSAKKACLKINNKYGNIISGYYCPYFGFEKDPQEIKKIIKIVKNSNTNILIVGLGAPKQEKFIHYYKNQYQVPLSIALGGTIDFAAGAQPMPSDFIKNIGLAWLWRLMREPKRLWRRYLIDDMAFFKLILKQKLN